jgi:hypothetical protein
VNRLGGEQSAYLASAAHQPVHWHPWSDEAFAAARSADKPILLDIGAVWCHWCHVMDGESYEDATLAAFLNEHFVCVKVDRDERPDVDARYQRAVQALTGQGGWPLTAILTPEGEVFYGGTYFPPDGKHGRPGFRSVLERVLEIYREQRGKVEATAKELRGRLATLLSEGAAGELSPELLTQAADKMARAFDFRYGGFGTQPKFPHPSAVEFLIARWWDTGEPWPREIAEKTLKGMARGGVYDQIGGGFHRYAVDERWIVPHFEKMSYDNAELLKCYAHAYAAFGTPLFRDVAEGIIAWNFDVMCERERGGFAASQDADVGLHDDGDYFTWTADEAHALLSAEEWDVARRRWDIYPDGEMHHDPHKNVLWVARSIEALVDELDVDASRVRELLLSAKAKLKEARDRRPAPFVDRTIYVNWNTMMAEAFLDAGAVLGREDCALFALKTLERLWTEGFVPGCGMPHRFTPPGTPHPAAGTPFLLDDQVQAASAFLTAHEHTGEGRWLDRARELADIVHAFYWDAEHGGFFDVPGASGAGFLAARAKPIQDAPTSSPNATAALVLLRLHAATEEATFRDRAEATLAAFARSAAELGLYASTYMRALDFFLNGECRVVVADTTTMARDVWRTALSTYRPRKVVVPRRESPVRGAEPPVALVCAGTACAAPSRTAAELRATLESFARGR